MPRLTDKNVLLETVRKGVAEKNFALSDDKDFTHELKFGNISLGEISLESFLVKSSVAQKLFNEKTKRNEPKKDSPEPDKPDSSSIEPKEKAKPLSKHFSMDVELDKTRLNKSFNACVEEVASYLMHLPNVAVSIRLAVNISAPEGIPEEIKEIVLANCNTLKLEDFYFEN